MTFGMPWTIGHGAENDEVAARILANAATRDSQGVLLPGDLKVHQTGTASGDLIIDAGAAVLRNVQAPGQSYIGPVTADHIVSPARNDTGADRFDLIIGRIRDPAFSPWVDYTDPEQIAHGPYWEPYIVPCSSGTKKASEVVTYSALALARLRAPARTATWDNSMLTELRVLAQPRIAFAYDVQSPGGDDFLAITDTSWRDWPVNSLSVAVPEWATHCQVGIMVAYGVTEVACDANLRVSLGGSTGGLAVIDYNGSPAGHGDERQQINVYAEFDVRSRQGQTVVVKPQAQRTWTMNTGPLFVANYLQTVFDVRFSERVV